MRFTRPSDWSLTALGEPVFRIVSGASADATNRVIEGTTRLPETQLKMPRRSGAVLEGRRA